ncbi:preprotein translocase subunit SecG [Salegentibacter sp. HM20]
MSTFTIFLALIVIVAFLLVVVIMVQNPKGGGLSSSFGGGGQQMGGVKKTSDFLDKSTWTLATLLLVLILLSNVTIMDGTGTADSRVFDGDQIETTIPETQSPVQQQQPAQTDNQEN